MAYTTTTTSITSATSSRSKQATVYQYPTGNGVVITGASVNSNTTAYLGVTTPGAAQTYTAVSGGATITEIVYLDSDNVPTNANAVSTTGGNIKIVGTGFASGAQVYINNALVTNTVPNSTAIIATLTTGSVGNVSCYIFGSGNSGGAISANSVRFSGAPSWVTAAAVSSVNGIASNIALQASGDGTLTYVLKSGSGSLPTGITLLSNGYLTGTATGYSADTVVTFTLIVRDTENQATQQTFNYTVFIGDTYFKQTSLLLSATVSNTFISDSSTNNFLITRNGDTRPSRLSPYWPGGWSGYFDGTGDYLTVPQSTSFDLPGDFTVECWVYFNSVTSTSFVGKWGGSGTYAWLFQYIAGTGLRFYTGINGGLSTTIDGAWTPVVNIWYHIAATRNSNSVRLFVNGTQVGTTTTNSDNCTATNQALNIGRNADTNIQLLTGYLSNLRILKGTALYTANFTPATTSLTTVANTSLLTLRDAILADDSPYNFTITRNGDTKLTTFSPFNTAPHTVTANTNSVYFDGTGDFLNGPNSTDFAFSGDFTVECWIYPTTVATANVGIYSSIDSSADNWAGVLLKLATSTLTAVTYTAIGDQEFSITHQTAVTANAWHHIALTRSGTTLRLFLDGVLGTTTQTSSTSYGQSGITIGAYYATSTLFTGYISNLRVQKGTAQYTANFTPSTSSLTTTANTKLLACQANTIIDSNTTPKTITVNGNPNVSLANPFGETVTTISNYTWSPTSYGASAYFDGTGDYLTANAASDWTFLHNGASDYTVEGYFFTTSTAVQQTLISTAAGTADIGIFIGINSSATGDIDVQMFRGVGGSYVQWKSAGSLFNLNSWNHFAFTFKTSTKTGTVFLNGRSVATSDQAAFSYSSSNPTFTLALGRYQNATPGGYLIGYLSDYRITKSILYANTYIPPASPVSNVANVSLLTLQSDIGSNSAQFVDQSPNNHLITRNGNASQGTYGPLVPSTWSAYFDGTGDYLSLTTNEAFDYGTGNFTIECWFYIAGNSATNNSSQKAAALFSTYPASSTLNGYALELGGNASTTGTGLSFASWVSGSAATVQNNSLTITQNAWHHVAVVRNGTSTTIYYDGGNVASGALSNQNVNTSGNALKIGTLGYAGYIQDFVGYISNARIIKGTAQYTANFTPATTTIGPVANTSLLTLRGPSFTDDSGNNFTITRNGDTKIVPFGPFSPQTVTPDSYSYRFSNASDYISTTSSNLAFGANNWTIESWVYPRFTANSGIFQVSNVQYGLTNSNLNTVALGFNNSNKAIVRVANATYTSTGTSITANAWTHLALVKSSNVSKLYINGTLDSTIGTSGSITDTVSYTGTTNVAVGGYGSTSALANAYISNFRVVSNSAVYTDNFTPAVGPLSAISGTTLLTCQANTVLDSSAANLTITANANVSPSSFNPFDETVTVGQQYSALADGGSAYFDGTGDYLTVSQVYNLTADFTIEMWVYPLAFGGMLLGNFGAAGVSDYLQLNSGGLGGGKQTGGIYPNWTSPFTLTTGQWYHLALVRSGSTTKSFYNGIPGATVSFSSTWFDGGTSGIGSYYNGSNYYTGYISNLRILKGTCLYNAAFVPPAAPAIPTTANTSLLLNFTSSGVIDSTGRNVLETVADAKVTTNLKKYGTGSYYFDGTGDYMYVMGNSTELAFGTGDFTIEFWINPADATASFILIDWRPSNTEGLYPTLYTQSSSVRYYVSGADRITGGALSSNNWTHVALARSGSSTKLFLNGTQSGSTYTDTNNYLNSANRPVLVINGYDLLNPMTGYLTDLRITKGYARYTANFTVPSEPFITK